MRRPRTLTVVMWFAGVYAVGATIGIAAAAAGIGEPAMGGVPVSRETWLRVAAPLVAMIAVLMGLTSIGLHRRRSWSRWPFMCIWPLIALYGVGCGLSGMVPWSLAARAWLDAFLFGAVATWLLFRHRPSAAWFAALRVRQETNPETRRSNDDERPAPSCRALIFKFCSLLAAVRATDHISVTEM